MPSSSRTCEQCGQQPSARALRCSQCKSAWYCDQVCQRKHWTVHKPYCQLLSQPPSLLIKVATVATRGAAGWTHFHIAGRDYLAVANFFISGPGRQPSMATESAVYCVRGVNKSGGLDMHEVQRFPTVGAHGVEHFAHTTGGQLVGCEAGEQHYLAVPNYYGGDSIVLRWEERQRAGTSSYSWFCKFFEMQRIASDGGGSIRPFKRGTHQLLGIAEFNVGVADLHILEGEYPNERFVPWQRIAAPGVGAMTTLLVSGESGQQLLLVAASYVTKQSGWRTRSPVLALNAAGSQFEFHHDLPTVGAHGVASVNISGRPLIFFSNDKDEYSTKQESELFEWVGEFSDGRFQSRQKVATDGAHAAEFFHSTDGERHFLAVANLGDRQTGSYHRYSHVFSVDPASEPPMTLLMRLSTRGATDFRSFQIGAACFLVVSNEQDDSLGGDIESTIWALR